MQQQPLTTGDLIVYGSIAFLVIALLTGISRRSDAIVRAIRQMFVVAGIAALAFIILQGTGYRQQTAFWGAIVTCVVLTILLPKRSRHIPRSERRKTIARFELETGKKYNPKNHDIDHDIPFSRGGNSTAENLRVRTRRANRSKGAKPPWWDILP